jgi:hypothetical protein
LVELADVVFGGAEEENHSGLARSTLPFQILNGIGKCFG